MPSRNAKLPLRKPRVYKKVSLHQCRVIWSYKTKLMKIGRSELTRRTEVEEERKRREEIYEHLRCPVCWENMFPPIFMCSSGHNVCSVCKKKIKDCPICRGPQPQTRNIFAEYMSTSVKRPCRNSVGGCTALLDRQAMMQHVRTCSYGFSCHVNDCNWYGLKWLLPSHCREMHKGNILRHGGTMKLNETTGQDADMHVLIETPEALFWFAVRKSKHVVDFTVRQVKPDPAASRHVSAQVYSWQLVVRSELKKREMNNLAPVLEEDEDADVKGVQMTNGTFKDFAMEGFVNIAIRIL